MVGGLQRCLQHGLRETVAIGDHVSLAWTKAHRLACPPLPTSARRSSCSASRGTGSTASSTSSILVCIVEIEDRLALVRRGSRAASRRISSISIRSTCASYCCICGCLAIRACLPRPCCASRNSGSWPLRRSHDCRTLHDCRLASRALCTLGSQLLADVGALNLHALLEDVAQQVLDVACSMCVESALRGGDTPHMHPAMARADCQLVAQNAPSGTA